MAEKRVNMNVLITGASSGIGLALASKYAEAGHTLVLIAREQKKLEAAAALLREKFPSCTVFVFSADVSNEHELTAAYTQIIEHIKQIDVLICNAGTLLCGRFETNSPEASRRAFDTNYWGVHYTVYCFLPLLRASTTARLAFVSSVAGYTGLFGYSHYAPSKFAVAGLAECLRMEFKDYGISVSVIYPPDTETPMLEFEKKNTLPECRALSKGARSLKVEYVAEKIVKDIEKKKFEIYFNFESKLIRILKGIVPFLYYRITDKIVKSSRKT